MMHPTVHQALVRSGSRVEVQSIPTPGLARGGLLVEVAFAGVCGTDLQILNGSRPDSGAILGHEGVGVVVRSGEGAALGPGECVIFNPMALPKGHILGHNVPGLFQELITLDESAVEAGLVVPAGGTPSVCGALVEPLGSVIYAYELVSRVCAQLRTAVVFGAGPIGLLTAMYFRAAGTRVLLVHPDPERLSHAVALKLIEADSTLVTGEDLSERLLAANGDERFDAALICTSRRGAPSVLQHAVEVLKSGGCIDMSTNYPETGIAPEGFTTEAIRKVRGANVCGLPSAGEYIFANVGGRRAVLTGHRGTSVAHLLDALKVLRSPASPYERLITHVLTWADAAAGLEILASGSRPRAINGRDCIKAVIDLKSRAAVSAH